MRSNGIIIVLLLIILLLSGGLIKRHEIWAKGSLSEMGIHLGFFEFQVTSFRDLSFAYEDHFDEVVLKVYDCEQFTQSYEQLKSSNKLDSTSYRYLTHELENNVDMEAIKTKRFGKDTKYMITYWDKDNCILYYNFVKM